MLLLFLLLRVLLLLHLHVERDPPELLPALQLRKLDHASALVDLGLQRPHQAGAGRERAAGRDQIVDQQDLGSLRQRIGVDLYDVGAVLQRVLLGDDGPGELAPLPQGDEGAAERERDWGPEDEPPGLEADDGVEVGVGVAVDKVVDGGPEGLKSCGFFERACACAGKKVRERGLKRKENVGAAASADSSTDRSNISPFASNPPSLRLLLLSAFQMTVPCGPEASWSRPGTGCPSWESPGSRGWTWR